MRSTPNHRALGRFHSTSCASGICISSGSAAIRAATPASKRSMNSTAVGRCGHHRARPPSTGTPTPWRTPPTAHRKPLRRGRLGTASRTGPRRRTLRGARPPGARIGPSVQTERGNHRPDERPSGCTCGAPRRRSPTPAPPGRRARRACRGTAAGGRIRRRRRWPSSSPRHDHRGTVRGRGTRRTPASRTRPAWRRPPSRPRRRCRPPAGGREPAPESG